jgi:peptidoglycan/LPS O-acetylase OafA/YrhL
MRIADLLKRKNNNLDLLRIVLASLVIVGHAPFLNGEDAFWHDPVTILFPFTYAGAVAVKLFFFISGLVVTNSLIHKKSVLHFVVSRVFRLMPALVVVLLITVFVFAPLLTSLPLSAYFSDSEWLSYIGNNLIFNTTYDLPGVFAGNHYPNTVNGSLWSLRYEVACYIVMLGLFVLLSRFGTKYFNIPVLLIIADAFLPAGFSVRWLGPNPEINLLPAAFAFGAFYAINQQRLRSNAIIALASLAIYLVVRQTVFAETIMILALCNVLLFVASHDLVLRLKPKRDISYGIYLWGFLVQQTLYHYFGPLPVVAHFAAALTLSVALAWATFVLVEKPFIEYGKKAYLAITGKKY